jgi:hypothetical protein
MFQTGEHDAISQVSRVTAVNTAAQEDSGINTPSTPSVPTNLLQSSQGSSLFGGRAANRS